MCFCLQLTLYLVNCLLSSFTLLYHVFSTKIPHIVMIRDTGEVPKVSGQENLIERSEKTKSRHFRSIESILARSSEKWLDRANVYPRVSIERDHFRSSESFRASENESRASETCAEKKNTLSIKGNLGEMKGDRKPLAKLRFSVAFEGIGAPDLKLGRKIEGFNALEEVASSSW